MCIPRTVDLKSTPLRKVCLNRDFRREYIHIYRTAADSTADVCPTCWGFCGQEFCSSDIAVPSILGPRVSERCKEFSFNMPRLPHSTPSHTHRVCCVFSSWLYFVWLQGLYIPPQDSMFQSPYRRHLSLRGCHDRIFWNPRLKIICTAHDLLTLLAHGSLSVSEGVFWDSFEHQKKVHLCCSRACVCRTKGTQLEDLKSCTSTLQETSCVNL